jgi:hypothetical protein
MGYGLVLLLLFECGDFAIALCLRSPTVMISERVIPQYLQTMPLYRGTTSLGSSCVVGRETMVAANIGGLRGEIVAHSREPLFTNEETAAVLEECECVAASKGGWGTRRHANYPTTDLSLTELPRALDWFRQEGWPKRIQPFLASSFAYCLPDPSSLRVVDAFVVKYDASQGQSFLEPHRDGSMLSFNLALNDSSEYDGGGTWFKSLGAAVRSDRGHVLAHASGMLHGGSKITEGVRYVLVAFVVLEGHPDFAENFSHLIRAQH